MQALLFSSQHYDQDSFSSAPGATQLALHFQGARLTEEAEAYRADAVNSAEGEAARFLSVYAEYVKAPEITRRRLYLETMERVYGGMNKVILDGVGGGANGQGVLPFLPLNELGRGTAATPAAPAAAAGGTN